MKLKKIVSIILATAMCATLMTGCGDEATNGKETGSSTGGSSITADGERVWEFMSGDPVTLTVYPGGANAKAGLIEGTIADWLLENYNIKLEIWPYSTEKTVSLLTSGDLPDIMYFTNATDVESAILGNMILNLEEHVAAMPHVVNNEKLQTSLNYIREFRSADTGEVYVMPTTIGEASSVATDTNKNGIKLHWDTYQAIGCPEMKTLEDTVQVFKDMQAVRPTAEDGTPVYGMRLYYGRNKTYEDTTRSFYTLYGYELTGVKYLVETDINANQKSILDEDSMYKRGVKWINTLMREGLIDPDSVNTDRSSCSNAVRAGYANAAVVDATAFPAEGFYYGFIDDMDIYYNTNTTFAGSQYIGIGANTKNVEAAVCFLDMLSDIDAAMQFTEGPEGELYEIVDGVAKVSKAYAISLAKDGGATFKFSNGEEANLINLATIINLGEETSYGTRSKVTLWPEAQDIVNSNLPIFDEWKQDMGYDTWVDLLEAHDALHRTAEYTDVASFLSLPSDDMALIISALQTEVIDYTWKLYYAENDEQFESLWKEMVDKCNQLGAADVIKWYMDDYAQAKATRDSLLEAK